jgi:hypothetical protein
VAHHTTDVVRVKYPTNALGESITRIDDAGDLFKNKVASFLPILDGKVLYVNMAGTLSGAIGVDHFNCRFVVFTDRSGGVLGKTELIENRTDVASNFASRNGSKEFSFCRASSSDRLRLGTISNDAAGEQESISGGGATLSKVVGMGGINIAVELKMSVSLGKNGKRGIRDSEIERDSREAVIGSGAPIDGSPVNGLAKVFGTAFEASIMQLGRSSGEFCQRSDSVANIRASNDV